MSGCLTFKGLQGAAQGYELRDLTVRAKFSTGAQGSKVVEREASPLQIDAGGQARSSVTYPSIQDIWPEVYGVTSIRAMEVRFDVLLLVVRRIERRPFHCAVRGVGNQNRQSHRRSRPGAHLMR